MRAQSAFFFAYTAIACLEFYSETLMPGRPGLRLLAKPALLTALSLYFFVKTRGHRTRREVLFQTALAFAWLGDVLLLREDGFLAGLGAFLVMQVLYAVVFYKSLRSASGIAVGLVIGYAVVVFWNVAPTLGSLLVPVLVYLAVIVGMSITAFSRHGHVPTSSFRLVAVGAVLFVLSDSFIALTRFGGGPSALGWLIMPTYASAQYLIVEGILREWVPGPMFAA